MTTWPKRAASPAANQRRARTSWTFSCPPTPSAPPGASPSQAPSTALAATRALDDEPGALAATRALDDEPGALAATRALDDEPGALATTRALSPEPGALAATRALSPEPPALAAPRTLFAALAAPRALSAAPVRSNPSRPVPRWALFALTLAALATGGCSFGFGSAFVGQWSPRKQVDFEACLRDPGAPPGAAPCRERKTMTTDVPGRAFWGVITTVPSLGASWASYKGNQRSLMRGAPSLEVLRGQGRWAWGVRTGLVLEDEVGAEDSQGLFAWDVTAMGHVNLLPRLSLYGGLGYIPYAGFSAPMGVTGERTSLGGQGLVGVQLALSKTHSESFILLNVELQRMFLSFDETYRSTGLTGNIGLFF
jgi:hypothetical protein